MGVAKGGATEEGSPEVTEGSELDSRTLLMLERYMECIEPVYTTDPDCMANCLSFVDILKTGHCAILRTSTGEVMVSMLVP